MLALLLGCLAQAQEASTYAVVLGVAQDAGHPQAGCDKSCCSSGEPHRVASLGLVDGDRHWIIDATPDFTAQEAALPGELAGVLLTHAHIGHYTGLMYLGREAWGAREIPVHAMPRMMEFLRQNGPWSQLVELGNVTLQPLADGEPLRLGRFTVTPIPVPHRDEFSETVGFHVRGPEASLFFLPDIDKWERWEQPVEDWIARSDAALLDGTFYDGDELPGRDMAEIPHPFVVESIERFQPLPSQERDKVYFIHLNHSNPLLREGAERSAVEAAGHHVATEGQRIRL